MADATRSQLEQAYRLIQQEELDQAIAILKPIVAAQPDNADAWWLMANAVSEPQEAYQALNNVLRLKPNHPEAKNLLSTLKEEFPYLESGVTSGFGDSDPGFDDLFGDAPSASTAPASTSDFGTDDLDALLGSSTPQSVSDDDFFSSSSSGDNLDDLFASDDMFGDTGPQFVQDDDFVAAPPAKAAKPPKPSREARVKQPKAPKENVPVDPLELEARANRRPSPFLLLAIVLFIVIIAGAAVLVGFMTGILGGQNNVPTPDPALAALFSSTNDEMTQNGFRSPQATVIDSSLGKTFIIRTCSTSGPDLPNRINKAMDISAKFAATIKDTIRAAGVQFVSCTKPDLTLYRAIAPIDKVVAYVTGNFADAKTFRSSWVKN
jgi:hypothetical protein